MIKANMTARGGISARLTANLKKIANKKAQDAKWRAIAKEGTR